VAAMPAGSQSHPHARGLKRPAERVDYIVDLMERLEWRRGKTAPELAAIWGVSVSAVENYSAEASRRVTADPDEARRDITAGCRKLFRDAVNEGDAKSARAVGELWATVSGAKAAEKHEHKVAGVTLDDLDEMKRAAEANECSGTSNDSEPSSSPGPSSDTSGSADS
jgi:hypothetical protein